MEIICCANPLNLKKVVPDYVVEAQAVSACSLDYSILNYDVLGDF